MALTGEGLANFAKSKVGTNYIYGYKFSFGNVKQAKVNELARAYPSVFTQTYINKIKRKQMIGRPAVDCSGLITGYTGKMLGSSQLYNQAYARLPISHWKSFAVGTVLWKSGHVGVYLGGGKVAEAKGIDYGTIISDITKGGWKYGLTFSWISYNISTPVPSAEITYKGKNPYTEPSGNLKLNSKGEGVKWLQWELVESGYKLKIDGVFGKNTNNALRSFQRSSKLTVDGICGQKTRNALKAA